MRTLDPDGDPVAASVVLRAIDEKLYAIGAAQEADLLDGVYAWVDDGVRATNWSHQGPDQGWGEGGDTGGGDGDDTRETSATGCCSSASPPTPTAGRPSASSCRMT